MFCVFFKICPFFNMTCIAPLDLCSLLYFVFILLLFLYPTFTPISGRGYGAEVLF